MRLFALVVAVLASACVTLGTRRASCESGDAAACLEVSLAYWKTGPLLDHDKALAYARRACALGAAEGCHLLGSSFVCGGRAVARSDVEAASAYEKACDLGDTEACALAAQALGVEGPAFAPKRAQEAARRGGCSGALRDLCEPPADFFAPPGESLVIRADEKPVDPTSGGLTADEVGRLIRAHWGAVKRCYERELWCDGTLEGRVHLYFQIGSLGEVVTASIKQSTLKSSATGDCIVQSARRWRFPAPRGGGVVNVNYPFIFRSE